jgi:hypothetical protein
MHKNHLFLKKIIYIPMQGTYFKHSPSSHESSLFHAKHYAAILIFFLSFTNLNMIFI